jgi:TetR/AcrR family transcriptional regulator, cholesterol catabolism regulator
VSAPEPSRTRRNRHREVVAAAIEVFWRKGYGSASLQEVADDVGVLKGSLYHYIESKEELLEAIVEDLQARSNAIVDEVLALKLGAVERVRTYVERHAQWCLENPREAAVFVREWRHLTGARLAAAVEGRRRYDERVRALIAAAQDEIGADGATAPKYASLYALAAVNAAPDWYHEDGPDSPAQVAAQYADLVVGMLRGAASRRDPTVAACADCPSR